MADLNDATETWQDGIYQLEQTDPVLGGPPNEATGAGMDNIPHLQLARRTRWLKAQVDALIEALEQTPLAQLAPLGSPVFSGDPRAPTPGQFDADSSIATTEFVQRTGHQFGGAVAMTGSATLTAAGHVGRYVTVASASASTLTLPLASTVPAGATVTIHSIGTGLVTVQRQGADQLNPNGGLINSQVIGFGERITLVSNGSNRWTFFGALEHARSFQALRAANGWQRLPGGLILQWGSGQAAANGIATITFPLAWPTSMRSLQATHIGTGPAMAIEIFGSRTATSTQIRLFNESGVTDAWVFSWLAVGD